MEEVTAMQATLMSWDEIKKKYPDRWVALADYRKDGSRIIEAVPVEVCEEKDMYSTEMALRQRGITFVWRRTSELEGANVLCRF